MSRLFAALALIVLLSFAYIPSFNSLSGRATPAQPDSLVVLAGGAVESAARLAHFQRDSLALSGKLTRFLKTEPTALRSIQPDGTVVDASHRFGATPLHQAAQAGNVGLANLLLSQGAPVDEKDRRGYTALHHAALHGHLSLVERLVQSQAHLDAQTRKGETPLHLAALQGHEHVVRFLLQQGAFAQTVNWENQTPQHAAWTNGHFNMAQRLDFSQRAGLLTPTPMLQ